MTISDIVGIADIKLALLGIAGAFAIGTGVGYYTKGQFVKADHLDAAIEAREVTASNIQESLSISSAVEQKTTASNQRIAIIRKKAVERNKPKETVDVTLPVQPVRNCNLDHDTVRLLNAARDPAAALPTGNPDAESQAASQVTQSDLIDNDIEVVGLYHELAERHDALVDWVQTQVEKQAQ